ncbi:MAG: DUF3187 family protein [Acidobacteria bacterium]|nr:DUF3187 family protein [Acidobacteriota bacterium]MCI0621156.1 DUF3187 family protein [Acidobacteriota bacterium]MCI0722552.1 DUF3187 family protein [Acidobacteriota bacterium]
MLKKTYLIASLCVVWNASLSLAQNQSGKLALLIPQLFGPEGLIVDTTTNPQQRHRAHFLNAFQSEFTQFNTALANQLTALPLPSPASGFTYSFDSASGVFTRSAQSFGPILAERAETIGQKKFTFGFSYQRFTYDSVEGGDLNQVRAVFKHDDLPANIPPPMDTSFLTDIVITVNTIKNTFDQSTFYFTYGLTDRLDVSLAVPTVRASLQVSSLANIQRLSGSAPNIHFFADPTAPGGLGSTKLFASSASATGIGDLTIRVKGRVAKWEHAGLAVGMDFRLPTGDEMDLLGSGAAGFRPFAAISFGYHRLSPHINLGYQFNGKSVLAGDPVTGTKASLPDQFTYIGGVDVGVTQRLTVALDILGQRATNTQRLFREPYRPTSFENIVVRRATLNTLDGAVGLKFNPFGGLLLNCNVIFKMNDSGLRDKLTPLFGVAYTF